MLFEPILQAQQTAELFRIFIWDEDVEDVFAIHYEVEIEGIRCFGHSPATVSTRQRLGCASGHGEFVMNLIVTGASQSPHAFEDRGGSCPGWGNSKVEVSIAGFQSLLRNQSSVDIRNILSNVSDSALSCNTNIWHQGLSRSLAGL